MDPLPNIAISVRQPWAWLICNGWKNIENRTWRTGFRGRVLIHAPKTMTEADYRAARDFASDFCDPVRDLKLPEFPHFDRGGIVGAATVIDCVRDHRSEWFCGPWGFVIADASPLPFHAVRGQLHFFPCVYPAPTQ